MHSLFPLCLIQGIFLCCLISSFSFPLPLLFFVFLVSPFTSWPTDFLSHLCHPSSKCTHTTLSRLFLPFYLTFPFNPNISISFCFFMYPSLLHHASLIRLFRCFSKLPFHFHFKHHDSLSYGIDDLAYSWSIDYLNVSQIYILGIVF